MTEKSEEARREKVRAIQLAALLPFKGDDRVVGEDVSLEDLARMMGAALQVATLDSYDAGYEQGRKDAELEAEHRRIELENWHGN